MSVRAALALGILLLLAAGTAHAYCRTSTCSSCPRDAQTGCTVGGAPVAWPSACVSFSMQEAASSAVDLETATALMREAFAVWENARCGAAGEKPAIAISEAFGPAMCKTPQYNAHAGNANVVMFRDDEWPYSGEGRELAATSLTVDGQGAIYDADVEINATVPLAVPTPEGLSLGVIVDQHDLMSIMVHEAGHFLGLDHSREEGSVMQAELSAGETRTTLSSDDVAAICAAYPPDSDLTACDDYTPRNGFASQCTAHEDSGCNVTRPGGKRASIALGWAGLLAIWSIRSSRRRRRA